MVGPWIHALWKRGKRLSDIEYLAIKEFDGKLVDNHSADQTAIGDGATLTASSGKDMYLSRAWANVTYDAGVGNAAVTVVLKVNGTIVESWNVLQSTSSLQYAVQHEFLIGRKVAATQIIKLEVTSENLSSIDTYIQCFEETTGESPET